MRFLKISRLLEYVRKYMTHPVAERENPVPNNFKGTTGIDTCIKRLLIENKTLTLNYKNALANLFMMTADGYGGYRLLNGDTTH